MNVSDGECRFRCDSSGAFLITQNRIINVGAICSVRFDGGVVSFMYQQHSEHVGGEDAKFVRRVLWSDYGGVSMDEIE